MIELEGIGQLIWKQAQQVPIRLIVDIALILTILCISLRRHTNLKYLRKKITQLFARQTFWNRPSESFSQVSVCTSITTVEETALKHRVHFVRATHTLPRTDSGNRILQKTAKALDTAIFEVHSAEISKNLNDQKDLLEQNSPPNNSNEQTSFTVEELQLMQEDAAMKILSLGVKKGVSTLLLDTECELVPPSTDSSTIL